MCMAPNAIFADFLEMLKFGNHAIKNTHNTFQDCHMHWLLTTFLNIAVFILTPRF